MTHPQRKINIYHSINRATKTQWTVPLSSDGYLNYGAGNQLTSDLPGANGFANPNAWCILSKTINKQQYQFCLQTDGYMGLRLKYSKVGFGTSGDNLVQTPSAPDEQVLMGSGTDAAPIYQQFISGILNFDLNRVNISIETATNRVNFTLQPIVPMIPVNSVPQKPVINTILK